MGESSWGYETLASENGERGETSSPKIPSLRLPVPLMIPIPTRQSTESCKIAHVLIYLPARLDFKFRTGFLLLLLISPTYPAEISLGTICVNWLVLYNCSQSVAT